MINTITDSINKINDTCLNLNKELDKNKKNYFNLKNGQNHLEESLKRLKKGKLSLFSCVYKFIKKKISKKIKKN